MGNGALLSRVLDAIGSLAAIRCWEGMLIASLAGVAGCGESRPPSAPSGPARERSALGASFVGGHAGGLEELLHADLVVQPPVPDSALRGPAAADYLRGLALHTRVTESRLEPRAFIPEGAFLLEQGTWVLREGDRLLWGRYHLRWRRTPAGWKVVLWRWTAFRQAGPPA